MSTAKTLIAITATAFAALAFAQSTPPQSGVADPAVGAGQRSTLDTPMGTTGTPGGAAAGSAASGSTMSSGGSVSSGASSGSTMSSGTASAGDPMVTGGTTRRVARADRN